MARLRGLQCELRVLPRAGTLADLWASGALGDEPGRCVLALDFDQTLTQVDRSAPAGSQLRMRGGEAARVALHAMHAAGVTLLIITAQSPSAQTLVNLQGELRHLGIGELFGLRSTCDEAADVDEAPSVVSVQGGVKIARLANCLAARYNKPEALQYWLENCWPSATAAVAAAAAAAKATPPVAPRRLVFVDDNSDNAVSMFMHFAGAELTRREAAAAAGAAPQQPPPAPPALPAQQHVPPAIPMCSVWYEPPSEGRGEAFDEATRELLHAVSRGAIACAAAAVDARGGDDEKSGRGEGLNFL